MHQVFGRNLVSEVIDWVKLEKVQRKFTKRIFKNDKFTYDERLFYLKEITLRNRLTRSDLILFHNLLHNNTRLCDALNIKCSSQKEFRVILPHRNCNILRRILV